MATVEPFDPSKATALVVSGPNAVTRNPMYVAMAGVLLARVNQVRTDTIDVQNPTWSTANYAWGSVTVVETPQPLEAGAGASRRRGSCRRRAPA